MLKFTLPLIAICLVGLAALGCQNQEANVTANRVHAETWVKNTLPGYTLVGFNSATLDTDNDGYVSTDITVRKDRTDELRLIQLDCPTASNPGTLQLGDGCKFKSAPFESKF